jgi:hypothetical protein
VIGDSFKNHTAFPLRPLYSPYQANRKFFQAQCMQSMLPSIPGNPLAVICARIQVVSSSFGDRLNQTLRQLPDKTWRHHQ